MFTQEQSNAFHLPRRVNVPTVEAHFNQPAAKRSLQVQLARNPQEVAAAQRLRYRAFFGAQPEARQPRDCDQFDPFCDHLLVVASGAYRPQPEVVGACRLMTGAAAEHGVGFYSATEFDIRPFLASHGGKVLLELGRSCVDEPYRTRRTIELLWRGIWSYVKSHRVDVMFGCASLPGTGGALLDAQIEFLARRAGLPAEIDPTPKCLHAYSGAPLLSDSHVFASLPPLVKAYVRLGARFSTRAATDRDLGVTDVFVVLAASEIDQRYINYFGGDAISAAMPSR